MATIGEYRARCAGRTATIRHPGGVPMAPSDISRWYRAFDEAQTDVLALIENLQIALRALRVASDQACIAADETPDGPCLYEDCLGCIAKRATSQLPTLTDMACPFCVECDFDAPGLKLHLLYCDGYNAVKLP